MSFLTERVLRLATPAASRVAAVVTTTSRTTTTITTPRAAALFSTTSPASKTPTEAAKEGLKKADRAVSDNILVPGLDAAAKAKDAAQNMTKDQAKGKAEELAGQAKGEAQEIKGQAKGAAHEAAGKARGAAEEVKRKL
ncbi:hypothetical protein JDV02_003805 [Purpureocillium takamizusanense]|uniref:LEA domain protein n=1 Tax=Purpureocillium takamizusanense TaxID=2060973 RepID=A0A9Q8VA30_9HYPO|nr:uncharacterized protein JDV02_003805 [Purpureocillium takamizusanense]UNI17464.1 hypothetical protein JDV02_003805 [Purpureocillium takamizusanense]